ncbi:hypothetical protein DTO271D3_4965 [Paecilomyces variotii]|nr:hypothetical protein DTO271D3_4965 [Paecilomyces variotii]KAJ9403322.1 hypothetical protein DTO045G8_8936 [Paecilomyces variotii]
MIAIKLLVEVFFDLGYLPSPCLCTPHSVVFLHLPDSILRQIFVKHHAMLQFCPSPVTMSAGTLRGVDTLCQSLTLAISQYYALLEMSEMCT